MMGAAASRARLGSHVSLIRRLPRARRSALAGILVASLVTTMLGPWLHADDGHDADFAPLVVHDASQHRLTADPLPAHEQTTEQHCVACHVMRLVRDELPVTLPVEPPTLGAGTGFHRAGHVVAQISGPPLPARAPPALAVL